MTIGQLRSSIQAYFSGATFSPGGNDLVLDALNNVKLEAMQRIDFELSYRLVKGTVGVAGTDLGTFTELDGTALVGTINTLRNAWVQIDGRLWPVDLVTSGTIQTWQRRLLDESVMVRYPSDAQTPGLFYGHYDRATFRNGNKVFYYPPNQQDVVMVYDVCVWLADYTEDSDSDFLTTYCHNFLKWGAIVELNPIFKEFVQRQEGNVSPQDAAKANAFDAMERWNAGIESQVPVQR